MMKVTGFFNNRESTNTSHYKLLIIFLSFQNSHETTQTVSDFFFLFVSDFVWAYMTKILKSTKKAKPSLPFKT